MQDMDTTLLQQVLSHIRSMDGAQILETIRRNIPQSAQMNKIVDKLKRINYRDATKDTLVEILEACGIPAEKSHQIIAQAKQQGMDVEKFLQWIKETDMQQFLVRFLLIDENNKTR